MKKTLLIISGLVIAKAGFSQLTQINEPTIGMTESYFLCDSSASNLENVIGASVVWDYSGLANYVGETRNITILDATLTDEFAGFTGATKAIEIEGLIRNYFSSTATERTSQGFIYFQPGGASIEMRLNSNAAILMTYPFAQGSSILDTYAGDVFSTFGTFPGTGSSTAKIDGTGTLNFPLGVSVPNVIRYYINDAATATVPLFGTVNINRKQFEYYDLATSSMPVLLHITIELVLPGGGAPVTQSLVLSKHSGIFNVGLDDTENVAFTMYPNPAQNEVTFNGELTNAKVTVSNALGQQVQTQTISSGETMNTMALSSGIYFVEVENNGVTSVQRLSIK